MRVYIPEQNKKNAICYFTAIIAGALLFAVSTILPFYRGVVQLFAFGFWIFGFWVLCRYSLSYFYYVIDGDNFRIVKVMGKRQQDVGNVSMRTGKFIKKESEAKKRPPAPGASTS